MIQPGTVLVDGTAAQQRAHRAGGGGSGRTRRRLGGLLGAAAAAALALAATAPVVASASAVGRGTAHAAPSQVASEASNGTTITMRRGGSLTLTLHSTYWSIAGSSNPSVLRERGTPVTTPAPPSAHCVPGQGCGTVSATFVAVAAGRADVTASRTTCGEALMCAPDQRTFVLHVVVTG
jgi:hypothetical protein